MLELWLLIAYCVVAENIHTPRPTEGFFFCLNPHPPKISDSFQHGRLYPPEKPNGIVLYKTKTSAQFNKWTPR